MNMFDEMILQKQENLKDAIFLNKQKESCKRIYENELKNYIVSGQVKEMFKKLNKTNYILQN